ncbi:unnamed protein product [Psylliodes chrysocephalus]|uniref:FLYWCH-type domain-containing protein n=1 Tax=Psylliodes chrysocephalus TaxID=3402493 RepID=A0A9P0CZ35_9CUCU|nr:unnamed protein product [Psylliodes chrysocephala]
MEATFFLSERGMSLLVIHGYTFSFQKMVTNKTVKRWQCSKRTCKAFVKTQGSDDTIVQLVLDHNHEKLSDEVFNKHLVSNSVKRKAVEDICEKHLKLMRNEIKNSAVETLTTKDIVRLRQNIYNARSSLLLKNPKEPPFEPFSKIYHFLYYFG